MQSRHGYVAGDSAASAGGLAARTHAPTGEGAPHSGRASRRSREAGLRTAAAAATQRAEVAQGQGVGPQGELLFDAKRRRLLLIAAVAAAHVRKRGQLGAIAPGRTVVVYIRRFT